MNRIKYLIGLIFILNSYLSIGQKKVLELPECLDNPYVRLNINEVLHDKYKPIKDSPWIVYSDRGEDFGKKFYVVDENATQVHIYSASGCKDKKLVNPTRDFGFRNKSELLVHYSSELLTDGIIHKKCVVLNKEELVKDIVVGKLSESDIPLYKSPYDTIPIKRIPLYYIYFIYKTENNRFLVGSDYKFQNIRDFKKQIFGWVDTNRVYQYNTRICFEPNYERQAIKERRCNAELEAKVFKYKEQISEFERGDTVAKAIWLEPEHYYLYKSDYVSNYSDLNNKLTELCNTSNDKIESLFESDYLVGSKFRFPLIKSIDENIFFLGCTGRYESNEIGVNIATCKNLTENKRDINISFIIDHTIPDSRSTYVLGQIDSRYDYFTKQYGACFFPRPEVGEYKKSIGVENKNANNYQTIRDFMLNYKPGSYIDPEDNCFNALNYILQNEVLDIQKTNIIILLNNSEVPVIPDEQKQRIISNIVNKNCYIIAFDYKSNSGLIPQLHNIMIQAANKYANKYATQNKQPVFVEINKCQQLENSGILAMTASRNPSIIAAQQVESFLNYAYLTIISTIDVTINDICANTGNIQHAEEPYTITLQTIARQNITNKSVRALVEGYSTMRLKMPSCTRDMWKAEVLMTEDELKYIISILNKFTAVSDNPHDQSQKIYELWKSLANRFVGDQLKEEEILDLTMQQILNKIIRTRFGYTDNDVRLKKYTLRKIKEKDSEAMKYFADYKDYAIRSLGYLRDIQSKKYLVFKNSSDDNNTILYYWIPIDKLP